MTRKAIVLIWDNFGPLHIDRITAVEDHFGSSRKVVGVELCGNSDTYGWKIEEDCEFHKETLFPSRSLKELGAIETFNAIRRISERIGKGDYILCHWNEPGIFLAAMWLRLRGRQVFTMGCSKFDDKPRKVWSEACKSLMFLPYHGALGSSFRSLEYFRFLGFTPKRIVGEYNTVSLDRVRQQAGYKHFCEASPREGPPHEARGFICVARLVKKKNHKMLIEAYAKYRAKTAAPRPLELCGDGPLKAELKAQVEQLGIAEYVTFSGFCQSEEISKRMAGALALLLPSMEEQFGNVVPEAMALGLPVVVSDNAGSRDRLVRTAQTGFIVEPDNSIGLAWIMQQLTVDSTLWERLREGVFAAAPYCDVAKFASGVEQLIESPYGR